MRVNIYAEEITQRIELVEKNGFIGLRFYLELPVTQHMDDGRGYVQHKGPFMHHPNDDDSAAVTFWGKYDTMLNFERAVEILRAFKGHIEANGNPITSAYFVNNDIKAGKL